MDGAVADETIAGMLAVVDETWDLRAVSAPEYGTCSVYHVDVETPAGRRECVLKAAPGDGEWGVSTEARVLSLLGARTGIPVPEVLGVVDEHREFPSPFFVMDRLPGSEVPYRQVGRLSDDVLRSVARQVGRCLGELHGVAAVDSYGYVTVDGTPDLRGGRPSGSPSEVCVPDWGGSWREFLEGWIESELDQHPDSPLDALAPRIESWASDRIAGLAEPGQPVLGWNDHGYHNLLLEAETGDVTGLIDWGYTLAVPPAFDFQYAEYLFGGSYLAALPGVTDRSETVRTALLDGYRSTAPDLVDDVSRERPLYELLTMVRTTNVNAWNPEFFGDHSDAVAERLRADIEQVLAESA